MNACMLVNKKCGGIHAAIEVWSFEKEPWVKKGADEKDNEVVLATKTVEQFILEWKSLKGVSDSLEATTEHLTTELNTRVEKIAAGFKDDFEKSLKEARLTCAHAMLANRIFSSGEEDEKNGRSFARDNCIS